METLYELTGQFLDIYNMELDEETKLDTLDSIELGKLSTKPR